MKVQEFLNVLEEHKEKELLFFYTENDLVGANYHLTEVKNVEFDTTDCGGKTNYWRETHLQLWESPSEIGKSDFMTTQKIASILARVNGIKPLRKETEIKIEYGNASFSTSVMPIEKLSYDEARVYVYLFAEPTLCKAKDECAVPSKEEMKEEACCETANCC